MKILNASQIKLADAFTIENEPIASIDLMERASKACYDWIKRILDKNTEVKVFCGMGNNGGDGLAIARMLIHSGFKVEVYKVFHKDLATEDFIINEKRLKKTRGFVMHEIRSKDDFPSLCMKDFVIDALIGTGLSSPLEGLLSELVKFINTAKSNVISIDMPSGLFSEDNASNNPDHIIRANHTLSFQNPKLSFFFPENELYTGFWHILDIGLNKAFINSLDTRYYFVQKELIKTLYNARKVFAHKGNFGHALLIAGSKGKSGAAFLSSKAALKSGIGLITAYIPEACYIPFQSALPEAMCLTDENEDYITSMPEISNFSVVGIGPGLGTEKQTQNVLKLLIQNSPKPLVIDADAINILAENPTWFSFLSKESIITPHPGEMDRIVGKSNSGFERLNKAIELSFKYGIFIILKGAYTAIVCPDKSVYFNSSGNAGMATAGSGDVLTGMVLSWLAQGYSPLKSCLFAVYLHGLAGDICSKNTSMESVIAGDIIENIGKAIRKTFY
ncbi:MAG: NAD(P)H-hydrate dehydratase [Bacteroidetes bacterium]|nr:NAD(P)H-hydrate dehydratase [Bacteroidota bacterium]